MVIAGALYKVVGSVLVLHPLLKWFSESTEEEVAVLGLG